MTPRRISTSLALLAAAALVAGGTNLATAPKARAVTCIRHVSVTFFVYSSMPTPTSNGCWNFERPVQANWYFVRTDGYTSGDPSNYRWWYDDTNPQHDLTTDNNRILQAASGRSYGYELMAYRNSAWRKLNPNGVVTRFYAEIYSGEGAVNDYYNVWTSNTAIGRPVINIGPISGSATTSAVRTMCQEVSSGTYIGIYSSQPVDSSNGQLAAVQAGLNDCTT